MSPAEGPALRDIHLPPPPAWWPPAPGWWLLSSICILIIIFAFVWLRRARARRREHVAVLAELDSRIDAARGDPAALAAALSQFLRRLALREAPAAAAFDGERWLDYLDARLPSTEFRHGVGRVLLEAPFRPDCAYDSVALIALVRRWTHTALAGGAARHA
jgi:hypothetical protein